MPWTLDEKHKNPKSHICKYLTHESMDFMPFDLKSIYGFNADLELVIHTRTHTNLKPDILTHGAIFGGTPTHQKILSFLHRPLSFPSHKK
jgi:hypothetical protein